NWSSLPLCASRAILRSKRSVSNVSNQARNFARSSAVRPATAFSMSSRVMSISPRSTLPRRDGDAQAGSGGGWRLEIVGRWRLVAGDRGPAERGAGVHLRLGRQGDDRRDQRLELVDLLVIGLRTRVGAGDSATQQHAQRKQQMARLFHGITPYC